MFAHPTPPLTSPPDSNHDENRQLSPSVNPFLTPAPVASAVPRRRNSEKLPELLKGDPSTPVVSTAKPRYHWATRDFSEIVSKPSAGQTRAVTVLSISCRQPGFESDSTTSAELQHAFCSSIPSCRGPRLGPVRDFRPQMGDGPGSRDFVAVAAGDQARAATDVKVSEGAIWQAPLTCGARSPGNSVDARPGWQQHQRRRGVLPLHASRRSGSGCVWFANRHPERDLESAIVVVDDLPSVAQVKPNQALANAQVVALPAGVDGQVDNLQRDFYKFTAAAGQKLSIEVVAQRIGSSLDPLIKLMDASWSRDRLCG